MRERDGDARRLALLGAGGLLAAAALAGLTSDIYAESGTYCRSLLVRTPHQSWCEAHAAVRSTVVVVLAVLATAALVASRLVRPSGRPAVLDAPLRPGVLALAPLAVVSVVIGGADGPGRLADGLLPFATALGALAACLAAGVGRRAGAWSHLLAAAALAAPLTLLADVALRAGVGRGDWTSEPAVDLYYGDTTDPWWLALTAVVVAAGALVLAVAADRSGRPAPDRRLSVAVLVGGVVVGVLVRIPGAAPTASSWLPWLAVPAVVASGVWLAAATRVGRGRRSPTSGSSALPR